MSLRISLLSLLIYYFSFFFAQFFLSNTLPISVFLLLLRASNFLYIKIPFNATILQGYTVNVINYSTSCRMQNGLDEREMLSSPTLYDYSTIVSQMFKVLLIHTINNKIYNKKMIYILIVYIFLCQNFSSFCHFLLIFFYLFLQCLIKLKRI